MKQKLLTKLIINQRRSNDVEVLKNDCAIVTKKQNATTTLRVCKESQHIKTRR